MQVAYQLCLFVLFEVSKECLSYPRVFLGRITKAMYLCPRAVTLVVSPASSRPLSFFSSSRCHQLSQALLQHYRSIASTTPFIPTLSVSIAGISSRTASCDCGKRFTVCQRYLRQRGAETRRRCSPGRRVLLRAGRRGHPRSVRDININEPIIYLRLEILQIPQQRQRTWEIT